MLEDIKKDARERMAKCVQNFQADLKKLRTGRAHPSLIEHLKVDYYGSEVPLQQVANIAVEDGRTLVVSPWEKTVVQAIEKAISQVRSRPEPDDGRHRHPHSDAAAHRGAPPRHHQGPAARRRERPRRGAQRAPRRHERHQGAAQGEARLAGRRAARRSRGAEADRQARRRHRRSCSPPRKKRSCRFDCASAGPSDRMPRHIAITMDGNGRWAAARGLPRAAGHKAGLDPGAHVHRGVLAARRRGADPVRVLQRELAPPAGGSVAASWRCSSRRSTGRSPSCTPSACACASSAIAARLSVRLQARIAAAEERTAANAGLQLQIAVSYGGRWDIVQAAQKLAQQCSSGALRRRGHRRGALRRRAGARRAARGGPADPHRRRAAHQQLPALGGWPTRSCTSPRCCGRSSTWPTSRRRSRSSPAASGASVPVRAAAGARGSWA